MAEPAITLKNMKITYTSQFRILGINKMELTYSGFMSKIEQGMLHY
jgi:hypothetical protein